MKKLGAGKVVWHQMEDASDLRKWWHEVLRHHGSFACYAIILALPGDREIANYLIRSWEELDDISGDDCLVIFFSNSTAVSAGGAKVSFAAPYAGMPDKMRSLAISCSHSYFEPVKSDLPLSILKALDSESLWNSINNDKETEVHEHFGFGAEVARYFEIPYDQLPCLILFRDVRDYQRILIDLRKMNCQELELLFRSVFTEIHFALIESKDPLQALEAQRKRTELSRKGNLVVSEVQEMVGKTIEAALAAFIAALIKKSLP